MVWKIARVGISVFWIFLLSCFSGELPSGEGTRQTAKLETEEKPECVECKASTCADSQIEISVRKAGVVPPSGIFAVFLAKDCSTGVAISEISDVKVQEDGVEIDRWETEWDIIPSSTSFKFPLLLLVDLSGSIRRSGAVEDVKRSVRNFLVGVSNIVSAVAIYGFDGSEEIFAIQPFTSSITLVFRSLDNIDDADTKDPSTNLNGAIVKALDVLTQKADELDVGQGILVIFTDGRDLAGRVSSQLVVEKVKSSPHFVFAVGLGPSIDRKFLETVGKDGFFSASDRKGLGEAFRLLSEKIRKISKTFWTFVYCSPKRAGEHVVKVLIRSGTKTGFFSIPFSADGFEAGCSVQKILERIRSDAQNRENT